MKKFYFDLQMFKGKGGSTTTYTMSPEERQLLVKQMGYLDKIYPNMIQLNQRAGDILWNSFADTQYDFNNANKNAQQQISNAQQGLGNLAQGQLPQEYIKRQPYRAACRTVSEICLTTWAIKALSTAV